MQALPLHKPPLPGRALTPANAPAMAEHTPTSADRSTPQPLPITGAHEPRSLPRSPRPAAHPDEVQKTPNGQGSGDGGGNSSENPVQPPQPPALPSRLRSHDSLTSAVSARPRSRATSAKPEPAPMENGNRNGNTGVPASNSTQSNGNSNNRPLNVTDALSYLDAVKVQFHDKPDVYNHFLDIMKDFKSQAYVLPSIFHTISALPSFLSPLLFSSDHDEWGMIPPLIMRGVDASFQSNLLHCSSRLRVHCGQITLYPWIL